MPVRVAGGGSGAGSGGGFRKVPESSGVCWCRFRRQVPEGSGEFHAGVGSGGRFSKVQSSGVCFLQIREAGSGRFRTVPMCAGVGSGGKFRKVPESSGVCWCRFGR